MKIFKVMASTIPATRVHHRTGYCRWIQWCTGCGSKAHWLVSNQPSLLGHPFWGWHLLSANIEPPSQRLLICLPRSCQCGQRWRQNNLRFKQNGHSAKWRKWCCHWRLAGCQSTFNCRPTPERAHCTTRPICHEYARRIDAGGRWFQGGSFHILTEIFRPHKSRAEVK